MQVEPIERIDGVLGIFEIVKLHKAVVTVSLDHQISNVSVAAKDLLQVSNSSLV